MFALFSALGGAAHDKADSGLSAGAGSQAGWDAPAARRWTRAGERCPDDPRALDDAIDAIFDETNPAAPPRRARSSARTPGCAGRARPRPRPGRARGEVTVIGRRDNQDRHFSGVEPAQLADWGRSVAEAIRAAEAGGGGVLLVILAMSTPQPWRSFIP